MALIAAVLLTSYRLVVNSNTVNTRDNHCHENLMICMYPTCPQEHRLYSYRRVWYCFISACHGAWGIGRRKHMYIIMTWLPLSVVACSSHKASFNSLIAWISIVWTCLVYAFLIRWLICFHSNMFTVVYSEAENLNASHFHKQNTSYLIRISNAYIVLYSNLKQVGIYYLQDHGMMHSA